MQMKTLKSPFEINWPLRMLQLGNLAKVRMIYHLSLHLAIWVLWAVPNLNFFVLSSWKLKEAIKSQIKLE
jgi:hypothetical protein